MGDILSAFTRRAGQVHAVRLNRRHNARLNGGSTGRGTASGIDAARGVVSANAKRKY
jgi:hypothetical protein